MVGLVANRRPVVPPWERARQARYGADRRHGAVRTRKRVSRPAREQHKKHVSPVLHTGYVGVTTWLCPIIQFYRTRQPRDSPGGLCPANRPKAPPSRMCRMGGLPMDETTREGLQLLTLV